MSSGAEPTRGRLACNGFGAMPSTTRPFALPFLFLLVEVASACHKTTAAPHAAGGGGGPAGVGGRGGGGPDGDGGGRTGEAGAGGGGGPGGTADCGSRGRETGAGGIGAGEAGNGGQTGAGGFGNTGCAVVVPGDCAPLFTDGGGVTTQAHVNYTLRVTDLSSDGKQDLIVADVSTMELLSNGGSGHFTSLGSYMVGARLFVDVATGDLNGDGLADVVVSHDPPGQIPLRSPWLSVFMNRPDGTLAKEVVYDLDPANGRQPYLAVGDLDGDHLADVLVSGTNTLSVFTNAGDGNLKAPQAIASLAGGQVALADVDRDGKPDIILNAGSIRVMMNQGSLTFAPAPSDVPPDLGGFFADFLVADLNGDGAPDLATIGRPQVNNALDSWLIPVINDGHGQLTRGAGVAIPMGARRLTAGDFNADGRTDLAVVNSVPPVGSITTLMAQKDMTYAAITCSMQVTSLPDLVAADLNGDGRDDLAVTAGATSVQLLFSAAPTP